MHLFLYEFFLLIVLNDYKENDKMRDSAEHLVIFSAIFKYLKMRSTNLRSFFVIFHYN